MTPEAGDWVAEHVLPQWLVAVDEYDMILRCLCQMGTTLHCDTGDHADCPQTRDPEFYTRRHPEAWIADRRGRVVALVRTGQGCHLICACDCGHTPPDPWTASRTCAGVEQPSLFAAEVVA